MTPEQKLYEYVDQRGIGAMTEWRQGLQQRDQAVLDQKLDGLVREGVDNARKLKLLAGPLQNTRRKGTQIYKLCAKGTVQLRPMICKGPLLMASEITLLFPAIEKDFKLRPIDAVDRADDRRREIAADPAKRRVYVIHEHE